MQLGVVKANISWSRSSTRPSRYRWARGDQLLSCLTLPVANLRIRRRNLWGSRSRAPIDSFLLQRRVGCSAFRRPGGVLCREKFANRGPYRTKERPKRAGFGGHRRVLAAFFRVLRGQKAGGRNPSRCGLSEGSERADTETCAVRFPVPNGGLRLSEGSERADTETLGKFSCNRYWSSLSEGSERADTETQHPLAPHAREDGSQRGIRKSGY